MTTLVKIMTTEPIAIDATGRTVASNIRRLRKMRGLTLESLALLMNFHARPMSKATLSQVENGKRRIDVDDLLVLAKVLHVNPDAILFPPAYPDGRGYARVSGFANPIPFDQLREWSAGNEPIDPPESPAGIDAEQWATWAVVDLRGASIAADPDEGEPYPNRSRG